MTSTLRTALAILALAGPAGAATLTMSGPTKVAYGETFEVVVTSDSEGEIIGEEGIYVLLNYDLDLIAEAHGGIGGLFTQFDGELLVTNGGDLGSCHWAVNRDDQCVVWHVVGVPTVPVDAGDVVRTYSFTAGNLPGLATFGFQDEIGSDFIFMSLGDGTDIGTAPAGWSVLITPEPATGALLAFGLAGLAARRRRAAPRAS